VKCIDTFWTTHVQLQVVTRRVKSKPGNPEKKGGEAHQILPAIHI